MAASSSNDQDESVLGGQGQRRVVDLNVHWHHHQRLLRPSLSAAYVRPDDVIKARSSGRHFGRA